MESRTRQIREGIILIFIEKGQCNRLEAIEVEYMCFSFDMYTVYRFLGSNAF